MNPVRLLLTGQPPVGGAGFNPAAAGNRVYGSGQPMPTTGRLGNTEGYRQRDVAAAARKQALLNRVGKF